MDFSQYPQTVNNLFYQEKKYAQDFLSRTRSRFSTFIVGFDPLRSTGLNSLSTTAFRKFIN